MIRRLVELGLYPLSASITVKNRMPFGMVRTAWNGVSDSKRGRMIKSGIQLEQLSIVNRLLSASGGIQGR
jgi:hypothetical protein